MAPSRFFLHRIYRLLLAGLDRRPRADEFAAWLGFASRHHLNREALRLGLPSIVTLLALSRLIGLIRAARREGRSLCDHALHESIDPAWVYRSVKHLTGQTWTEMRHATPRQIVRLSLRNQQRRQRGRLSLTVAERLRRARHVARAQDT